VSEKGNPWPGFRFLPPSGPFFPLSCLAGRLSLDLSGLLCFGGLYPPSGPESREPHQNTKHIKEWKKNQENSEENFGRKL
jgi:hypothetical protein